MRGQQRRLADEAVPALALFPPDAVSALMAARDWSATPLGPAALWPQSLRTALGTCLECALPAVLWWGPKLVTFHNPASLSMLGPPVTGARAAGQGVRPEDWSAVRPDLWRVLGPLVARVMQDGRPIRSRDLTLPVEGGEGAEESAFSFSFSPVRDETGSVAGVFCLVIETTGRVIATRRQLVGNALSEIDGPPDGDAMFRAVADHVPAVIWLGDVEGRTAWLSRGWHEMTGEPAGRLPHDAWSAAVHPGDIDRVRAEFLDATSHRARIRTEYRLHRADGGYFWVLDAAQARFDADGRYAGYIGAIMDIDDRRQAELHRSLLIDELNHRVKNTLSIVQGIARQSLRDEDAPSPALMAFEGRLGALAAAHGLLTRLNWEAAGMDEIVRAAIRPVCGDLAEAGGSDETRVEIAAVPVRLRPKQAVSFAIALHELASNARKFGALSAPDGHVAIDWEVIAESADGTPPHLRFSWIESGGPEVSPPGRRGFGSRLIERALAAELGGEASLEFRREGIVCRIEAPLSECTEGL